MTFIRLIKIEFNVNDHWSGDYQYYIELFIELLWGNGYNCGNFIDWAWETCQSKTATRTAVAGTNESRAY